MGVVRRQSFFTTIFVYVSMFIGYVNLLILMPIYFSPSEIGMTRSILTLAVAFAQLAELGTSSIIYRFFPIYEKSKAKDFLGMITVIPLLGFSIFVLVALFFQDSLFKSYFEASPELKKYTYLIFYLTFFTLVSAVFSNYSIANLKSTFPRAVNELIPKLGNTILILLFAKSYINFDQYFFWFCTLTAITSFIVFIYLAKIGVLHFNFKWSLLTKRLSPSIIKFGSVAILGSSFATIINYIDVIMLGGMMGQAEVAQFSIGFYIISIMSVPFVAIITIVTPLVSKAIRKKNWGEVLKHYRQTSLNNFIIGGFIFVMLILTFPEIIYIMPKGKGYENAFYIVLYLGIGRLFDMITGCNSEIILLSKHYMFNFYSIIVISILKILMNYFFIHQFGILGVAITGLITLILFNSARYLYIWRNMHIQPFTPKTVWAILALILSGGICWICFSYMDFEISHHMYFTTLTVIVVKSIIWTLVFVPLMLFLRISQEMNSFMHLFRNKFSIWLRHK